MVLGLLAIAVLAGLGFDRLRARLAPGPRRAAGVVAGGLLLAEFAMIPYRGVPYRLEIPAVDLWVARQQKPFTVAEVPVTWSARYHSNYMLHSMAHWQKTVHGYSGIQPALHDLAVRPAQNVSERRQRSSSCAARRDLCDRAQQLVQSGGTGRGRATPAGVRIVVETGIHGRRFARILHSLSSQNRSPDVASDTRCCDPHETGGGMAHHRSRTRHRGRPDARLRRAACGDTGGLQFIGYSLVGIPALSVRSASFAAW